MKSLPTLKVNSAKQKALLKSLLDRKEAVKNYVINGGSIESLKDKGVNIVRPL